MKSTRTWQFIFSMWLIAALFLPPNPASAQAGIRVKIDYLSDTQFPLVQAYISVSDTQGLPVMNLKTSNFTVSEDNQPVTDFEVSSVQNTQQPLAIVLAIDTSGSMGYGTTQTALQESIQAAKTFIGSLAFQDYVAIVSFSDTPSVAQDFTTDHAALNAALDSLRPEYNTAMYDAIAKASTMLSNRGERKIIVLLTDGVNTGTGLTFDQAVNEAQERGVPIYPIGFGAVDQVKLQNLAALTGGSLQIQPDSSTLGGAFTTVLQILREQYLLEYYSSLPADGAEHALAVTLDFQGWHEELTHRFVAQPGQVSVNLPGYTDGQVISGNVRFAPTWTVPSPAIAQLDVSMDDKTLSSIITAPFEYTWNSTSTDPGKHFFTFVVTDTAGNTGQTSLDFLVQIPVTVQIVQPLEDATIEKNTSIMANVMALGVIDRVEFSVDGQKIGTVVSPPYQLEWDPGSFPAGRHVISVVAYDSDGFSAQAQATVNVAPKQALGVLWILGLVILAVAAILIPVSLRKRKKFGQSGAVELVPQVQAVLHELEGLNPGKDWPLGLQEVRLGRKQDENNIILIGAKASRKHAVIRVEEDKFVIESLSSDNPLIINDEPVQQHILSSGDMIRLGDTLFKFE
jgi:Ca-activated chloride channel family protein